MSELAKYAILAGVGAASGVAGHYVGARLHGSGITRVLVRSVVESLVLAPGVFTLGFFLSQATSSDFPSIVRVWVAFVLPYIGARIGAVMQASASRRVRAHALPFDHWIDLLRRDPRAASSFLHGYLAEYERRATDPLSDLRAVFASMERVHAGDPVLSTALQELSGEIERLEFIRSSTGARVH